MVTSIRQTFFDTVRAARTPPSWAGPVEKMNPSWAVELYNAAYDKVCKNGGLFTAGKMYAQPAETNTSFFNAYKQGLESVNWPLELRPREHISGTAHDSANADAIEAMLELMSACGYIIGNLGLLRYVHPDPDSHALRAGPDGKLPKPVISPDANHFLNHINLETWLIVCESLDVCFKRELCNEPGNFRDAGYLVDATLLTAGGKRVDSRDPRRRKSQIGRARAVTAARAPTPNKT